ncbi:MAG: hypothetical protein DRJ44_03965 [Thermoprotei archaeon]|nr:MAG: hypothetical protein DRJ44_03965 [Thermoprotei archaeon]
MEEYNPWWFGEVDPVFEEWRESPVRWIPRVLEEFSFKPFSLHFFVGPRQVGKTTALKILIYKLLEVKDARSIFYFACDEVSDFRELGEILDNYFSYRRGWGVKGSIIFLDEITFVEEWFRALKSRIDKGFLRNDVLVVTGSAGMELIAGRERFPGRRGLGKDIYMYPMFFSEYVGHFSNIELLESGLGGLWEKFEANRVFSSVLQGLFLKYLETGGFPVPIREMFERGRVSFSSRKVYLDWLKADWLKAGKSENYMKEVISYLLETAPSPVGWSTIAKNTSISSPHTARDYVELLENLMIAKVLYWISPSGRVDYRKNKKVIFIDPFIYRVFSSYARVEVGESAIVEATVASHLSKWASVYYWRNRSEVDIVVPYEGEVWGFEVKWRRKAGYGRRPFKTVVLDRETIPVFLATLAPRYEFSDNY